VSDAVHYAHQRGILHRDLKPSNVLVGEDGRVVILDFGLVATGVVDVHQSYDGPAGTPGYMSPEQAAGAPLTVASDFYTLGVMLYEALTGQPPFSGSALHQVTARATQTPHDPRALVRGLPDDLCDLAMDLLALAPEARPTGAAVALLFAPKSGREVRRELKGRASEVSRRVGAAADEVMTEVRNALPHGDKEEHSPRLQHLQENGERRSTEQQSLAGRLSPPLK